MMRTAPPEGNFRGLPASVWALGLVSLLMDVASELVHSLLPLLLVGSLGASLATVGLIEGLAQGTAALTKVFSGWWSDRLGQRKALAVLGYGLGALSKPVFPLAGSALWVAAARCLDRLGKGIRGTPRDALIADLVAPELRGAAFGLRQALDSVGAFLGPLLAIAGMLVFAGDIRTVLWLAVLPAALSVLFLVVAVREPRPAERPQEKPVTLAEAAALPRNFWWVVGLGGVFTLARFSDAFLILRAESVGLSAAYVPGIMIVMNIVYALAAYPAGAASDRHAARPLLVVGLLILVAADAVLALARTPAIAFCGAALWGLHMAFTQGLLARLVADAAPARLRGTAFGLFNLMSGIALFLASGIAGTLWSHFGAAATFYAGAAFAALAAAGLLFLPAIQPGR